MDTFSRVCFPKIHCTHVQDFDNFQKGPFEQKSDGKFINGTLVRVTWCDLQIFLYVLGMPERIRWVPAPETLFGEIGRGLIF